MSRAVAFWPVQGDASGAVWNGVQLRATLWDGFVGSNVGFFADRNRAGAVGSSLEAVKPDWPTADRATVH